MQRRTALCLLATFAAITVPGISALAEPESTRPKAPKKLYLWRSETEFVIAEDEVHAAAILLTHIGPQPLGFEDSGARPEDWTKWPEDKLFPFTEEVEGPEGDEAYAASQEALRELVWAEEEYHRFGVWRPRSTTCGSFWGPGTTPWKTPDGSYVAYTIDHQGLVISPPKPENWPALRDCAWLLDGEKCPKPYPQVIWHISRRNNEAKNIIWGKTTRLLPAEWVERFGEGYVGSTEY